MWLRVPINLYRVFEIVFFLFVMSFNFYLPPSHPWWIYVLPGTFVLGVVSSVCVGRAARSWMVRARMWHWGKDHFESFDYLWDWFEETPEDEIDLCLAEPNKLWGMDLTPESDNT